MTFFPSPCCRTVRRISQLPAAVSGVRQLGPECWKFCGEFVIPDGERWEVDPGALLLGTDPTRDRLNGPPLGNGIGFILAKQGVRTRNLGYQSRGDFNVGSTCIEIGDADALPADSVNSEIIGCHIDADTRSISVQRTLDVNIEGCRLDAINFGPRFGRPMGSLYFRNNRLTLTHPTPGPGAGPALQCGGQSTMDRAVLQGNYFQANDTGTIFFDGNATGGCLRNHLLQREHQQRVPESHAEPHASQRGGGVRGQRGDCRLAMTFAPTRAWEAADQQLVGHG